MDDDPRGSEDDWPIPPAWMWGCEGCVETYTVMKAIADEPPPRNGVDNGSNGSVPAQIRLAQHIVAEHLAHVPPYSDDCTRCADYQDRAALDRRLGQSAAMTEELGREHRARHLFAPRRIVHLM
ncbi:hypothetical protein QWM81_22715 [Streptomyces ficellus]|uniref:Oxidoreductase n=1 Tax=Streptomyces ficellus TaxID=1977088 RepID=A0ABT7ZBJ2_9ACTN|nr:hypothetical protein [Streptomyces ficellus]MDN3296806.1 hypothetical protein [Streptomyces ficellus]